ncbi:MAG: hypothetical protein WKF79_00095 [Nocardioides sp.]
MARYKITAAAEDRSRMECFVWTRDPASGVRRAQADARRFGMGHLTDFRAEPIA